MSISQWYSLAAIVIMAPHLSRRMARWVTWVFIALSIVGPFIAEWMSK